MDYKILPADTSISKLAVKFGVKPERWPEFCKANPKLKPDPNAGCLFYVGKTVTIPDSWVASAPPGVLPAPPGGAVPQPVGPPIDPLAPAPAPGLFGAIDTKKVIFGAAAVATVVVAVYAIKRKGRSRSAQPA